MSAPTMEGVLRRIQRVIALANAMQRRYDQLRVQRDAAAAIADVTLQRAMNGEGAP